MPQPNDVAAALMPWYDAYRRELPWRGTLNPYQVWISETILQQTTVQTGMLRYVEFLERFPTLQELAAAPTESVLDAWAGLGYYARARNLHRAAQILSGLPAWPRTAAELQALPGIGPYTARAIAAIAFQEPVIGVDTNVRRVVGRIFGLPPTAKEMQATADALATPGVIPGDMQQVLFDLGARVCRPKDPLCHHCPAEALCVATRTQDFSMAKAPRPPKPQRQGVAYVAVDPQDRVLVERRPATGLLGGTLGLPGSPWAAGHADVPGFEPCTADWEQAGTITHIFAHFRLDLTVKVARVAKGACPGLWEDIHTVALPTVMQKAVDRARSHLGLQPGH